MNIPINNLATVQRINTAPTLPVGEKQGKLRNTLAQIGRTISGIAKGTLKTAAAPGLLREGIDKKLGNNSKALPGDNWLPEQHFGQSLAEATRSELQDIDARTGKWIPPPQSAAAQVVARASDIVGQAIPAAVATLAGGAETAGQFFAGNTLGRLAGSAIAFSSEIAEGSGDVGRAVIRAGTAYAAEAIGGATFDKLAGAISSPVLGRVVNMLGEGLEENIEGVLNAAITGENYTAREALTDLGYGTIAGAVLGGFGDAVNAVNAEATRAAVGRAVNADIKAAAQADVQNVQALIKDASSPAETVIAEDSLRAIQRQTANPVNEYQTVSNISEDIAQRFDLRPARAGEGMEITVRSYESIVNPVVSQLEAPSVSLEERASINPNEASADNPRALYQYAEDIYLRPGTEISADKMYTYRGQANRFYSSTIEKGVPASGVGTSFEGSGVYSAETPYTTDLYGPSGKLPDNPYANRGIPQKAVESANPIGVILEQNVNLNQEVGVLQHSDAPEDVVEAGTRRVRYDPSGRMVTEIVNNPQDISAIGLNFGRTTIEEATPIQYASGAQIDADARTDAAALQTDSIGLRTASAEAETASGEYTVPNLMTETTLSVASGEITRPREAIAEPRVEASGIRAESLPSSRETVSAPSAESTSISSGSFAERNGLSGTPKAPAIDAEPVAASRRSYGSGINGLSGDIYRAQEGNIEGMSPDEYKARSIWTPEAMQRSGGNVPDTNERRDRRDNTPGAANTFRGRGSSGRIFESERYNSVFGNL